MKFIVGFLAVLILISGSVNRADAHVAQPFIKINGVINEPNMLMEYIFAGPPKNFILGGDLAAGDHYVGETLTFEIDNQYIPLEYTVGASRETPVDYRWEFGDGLDFVEGEIVGHVFDKPGTYIVKLTIKSPQDWNKSEPTATESVQLNILPARNAPAPVAGIALDGKLQEVPAKEITQVAPGRELEFDASASKGKIAKYLWDFGDGTSGEGMKVKHAFKNPEDFPLTVILRVVDENNVSDDTYLYMEQTYGNAPEKITGESVADNAGFFGRLKLFFSNLLKGIRGK